MAFLSGMAAAGIALIKGAPDVLVSTPGINVRKPLLEITDEEFDRAVESNPKGTFRLIREFGRGMAERGSGSIIAFSGIRAQTVEPGQGVYAATKSGAVQMLRALAAEIGRDVRVNAIAPGIVETPLTAQIRRAPSVRGLRREDRAGPLPHEITGAIVYPASGAGSYVAGAFVLVDGGWAAAGRFAPPP